MTAYGYVRSATGNPEQIEDQRQAIVAMFERAGMTIETIYADVGSGLIKPVERPGFEDLLGVLGRGDILAMTDPTRISRDPALAMGVLLLLSERGVEVRIVPQSE
jgi:DNA invertase Pin-like site-specific DNA recombinase